jgi:p-aminobenzoyl-glutamate transporter AbgT
MKRRESPWKFQIITAALMALTVLLGFAESEHIRESPEPFVRAVVFFGIALLILLGTIQDLMTGTVKMERYGVRVELKRPTVSYWLYIVIAVAFVAFCAFEASMVFWLKNPQP